MAAQAHSLVSRNCQNGMASSAMCRGFTPLSPAPHRCRSRVLQGSRSQKLSNYTLDNKKAGLSSGASRRTLASASASPGAPSLYDPIYREKLAQELGFTQIGEPLPPTVTLRNVMETLPPEVFELNEWKAWRSVAISVAAYAAGLYLTAEAPWYLLPFAWAWTGTAIAGFFCIGHDCAHKSFSSNKLVEDIVGNLAFLPLIYPYEGWRFKHDQHHAKTNMLVEDTAWHPIMREDYDEFPSYQQLGVRLLMGPFRPWASIGHWIERHFDPDNFRVNERNRVKISLALTYGFMGIGWPLIIYMTGITGWVNFWLMPWLIFHFWLSIVTMVHHTAPHIGFDEVKNWNSAQAQLVGTVHCDYPKWVEFLCHDINVHVPHHISPRIPSYNLRLANEALRERWGKHFNETRLSWRLMKTIFTECHLYDEQKNYAAFDEGKEEESFVYGAMRKLMPNTF